MPDLRTLLKSVVDKRGSDLHLIPGSPPRFRVEGRLLALESDPLTGSDTHQLARDILNEHQQLRFQEMKDLDCAVSLEGVGRFRCHVSRQQGSVSMTFRVIPSTIPSFEHLGLPRGLEDLVHKPQGMLLVTGPTGSGKSTTLAALVDKINAGRCAHVVSIEDPIEFLHSSKKSVISQREVGTDTHDFPSALRAVFRQDPDVVVIGEMADLPSLEAGLSLAEGGHLVLASLPTISGVETIHGIIHSFPPHQHPQVRTQLASVLLGVVSQLLVPQTEGRGRVLALEILIPTVAIRNLIRENKISQIYSVMQTGQAKYGIQTMNQALFELYKRRMVSAPTSLAFSHDPSELQRLMERGGPDVRTKFSRPSPITWSKEKHKI